jgi:hypothetical protein
MVSFSLAVDAPGEGAVRIHAPAGESAKSRRPIMARWVHVLMPPQAVSCLQGLPCPRSKVHALRLLYVVGMAS